MFHKFIVNALLLASGALALTINSVGPVVPGGSTVITFTPDDPNSPVTLILRQGNAQNLNTLFTITSTATGGSYTWQVPATLPNGSDYALEIEQGASTNYLGGIAITGSSATGSFSATGSATATGSMSMTSAATMTSGTASASASTSMSMSTMPKNATTTKTSSTMSTKISTSSLLSNPSGSAVPKTGGANMAISSPVALIMGAVAAMFYL